MDRLQSMRVFEQVVSEQSFSAGARKLDLSPATVTRLVRDLEDHLGVQLLQRTTRRLALTAAGEAYIDRVRHILGEIDEADESARSHASEMSGVVRVLALPGLATHLVAPVVAAFHRQHPKVTLELSSDPHPGRRIEDHDIALLTDQSPLPADAVVRPVLQTDWILCASPEYLRQNGEPRTPQALAEHALIRLSMPDVPAGPMRLYREGQATPSELVSVEPALLSNDHEAALRGTLEGVGISCQTVQVAAPLLRAGRLRRVLTAWSAGHFTLSAVFASRRHMPARVRAFLDHLVESAAGAHAEAGIAALRAPAGAGDSHAAWLRLQPPPALCQ